MFNCYLLAIFKLVFLSLLLTSATSLFVFKNDLFVKSVAGKNSRQHEHNPLGQFSYQKYGKYSGQLNENIQDNKSEKSQMSQGIDEIVGKSSLTIGVV